MKVLTLLYVVMYLPCRLSVGLLSIFSPLSKLNMVLQLQKKRQSFKKCK